LTPALLLAAILIRNVTVIDGTGAEPRRAQTVLIVDGRIAPGGRAPKGATILNGTGKFLIPGLWDMHAHLTNEQGLGDYLRHGITAVRDMGSDGARSLRWRADIEAGRLRGPRIFTCGTAVDGRESRASFPVLRLATPEDGFNAAERLDAQQVDFVKILGAVPRDAYFALAQRARVLRLPFAGHVPESIAIEEAVENRQRSIEHLDRFPDPVPADLISRMLSFDTRVVPTLASRPKRPQIMAALLQSRVVLLAGSGGSDPLGLHRELENLVAAGMTPLQAIRAATFDAAHFFGWENRSGCIQEGRIADLVLLNANPVAAIRNLRRISAVIVGGKVIRPAKRPAKRP
jgi:imidazolonepropionase-like amidohydrolase